MSPLYIQRELTSPVERCSSPSLLRPLQTEHPTSPAQGAPCTACRTVLRRGCPASTAASPPLDSGAHRTERQPSELVSQSVEWVCVEHCFGGCLLRPSVCVCVCVCAGSVNTSSVCMWVLIMYMLHTLYTVQSLFTLCCCLRVLLATLEL